MLKNSFLRTGIIILFSVLMIWVGFKRENRLMVMENFLPHFIHRYPKPDVAAYDKEIKKSARLFSLPAKLQSSILFSLSYLFLATLILFLLSLSGFIAKLTAGIYLVYMILCMLLIGLGMMGVDYRLSTGLSHYLEDLFLSPFFVMALAVLIKAFGFTPDSAENKR